MGHSDLQSPSSSTRTARTHALEGALAQRILVLDGAMGTMIQRYRLTEAEYRGERFAAWKSDLRGNNDLLTLTRPQVIREIHGQYLDAGADILETNTFNSTSVSMADYHMESLAYELNFEGAKLAREVADAHSLATPLRPRFVAGVLGPMNRTLSLSPDVNDPGFRAVNFDQVKDAYRDATRGLIDGAESGVVHIRRQRECAIHWPQHTGHKSRVQRRGKRLRIGDFTRQFGPLKIQLISQRLHVIVGHGNGR